MIQRKTKRNNSNDCKKNSYWNKDGKKYSTKERKNEDWVKETLKWLKSLKEHWKKESMKMKLIHIYCKDILPS